jgi:NADPH:quinone reductase-like Zn-dependent oxidoreductase
LVKVRTASVNPLDWHFIRGTPYVMRASSRLRKPKVMQLGVDFAGTVEAVGKNVTRFKPGDEVYGGADGSFAEYVTPRAEGSMALKPANMSFEQAATVPIAAITALQALRDQGQLKAGQKVLINGASGGVGTFAVQIAKSMGAQVTGVCSTRNWRWCNHSRRPLHRLHARRTSPATPGVTTLSSTMSALTRWPTTAAC